MGTIYKREYVFHIKPFHLPQRYHRLTHFISNVGAVLTSPFRPRRQAAGGLGGGLCSSPSLKNFSYPSDQRPGED